MGIYYRCPICGNDDINKIGIRNGQPYCRACIRYQNEKAEVRINSNVSAHFCLDYELTIDQQNISDQLVKNYISHKDTLIYAVTGAGKTELVFQVIAHAINHHGKVGFAIPRKDVVIELFERLKTTFKNNKVIAVYGGHQDLLDGDIICLTAHQLSRYPNCFDLLIVDEIDAFPYHGNQVLNSFVEKAKKGVLILMSATPSKNIIDEYTNDKNKQVLILNKRYHHYPLCIPKVVVAPFFLKYLYLIYSLKKYKANNKPVFVFTPTINLCERLYNIVKFFVKNGTCVHSKKQDRDEIIKAFKEHNYDYLVTTAVLERGVTVKDLQVVVFCADHDIYDEHSLVQISGRVGRKKDAPIGDVVFLVDKENENIKDAIETIKRANRDLQSMF